MKDRIKNLFIFIICKAYSVIRKPANKPIDNPSSVMIIQMAKLGDMVCTTPLFAGLKKNRPNCHLTVVGNKINKELLAGNSDIDKYLVFGGGFWSLHKLIKNNKPDVLILTGPGPESLAAAWLAGVKSIIAPKIVGGFCPYQNKTYLSLLKYAKAVEHKFGSYAPREYLKLLEPFNILERDTTKKLYADLAILKKMKNIAKVGRPLVGISFSAGNEIKRWPKKKFIKLINNLVSQCESISFIIIGASADKKRTNNILDILNKKVKYVNLVGQTNISELKAVISLLDLYVSVDSGPIYIAEALGVPTVDILGPMDEKEQPPRGEKHRVVFAPRKRAELHIMNARVYNKEEARRQARDITVASVIKEIEYIIDNI